MGGAAAAAAVAKPAAYVPPHLRGVAAPAVQKLHNYEPPKKIDSSVQVPVRISSLSFSCTNVHVGFLTFVADAVEAR
jgi:hypothetical protein